MTFSPKAMALAAAFATAVCAPAVHAQSGYPTKQIRWIVP